MKAVPLHEINPLMLGCQTDVMNHVANCLATLSLIKTEDDTVEEHDNGLNDLLSLLENTLRFAAEHSTERSASDLRWLPDKAVIETEGRP